MAGCVGLLASDAVAGVCASTVPAVNDEAARIRIGAIREQFIAMSSLGKKGPTGLLPTAPNAPAVASPYRIKFESE